MTYTLTVRLKGAPEPRVLTGVYGDAYDEVWAELESLQSARARGVVSRRMKFPYGDGARLWFDLADVMWMDWRPEDTP